MKTKLLLIVALGLMTIGCSKKEDAPKPQTPHVAGSWSGNGSDDAVGYFDIVADITQSGDSAAGDFTMTGGVATIKGTIILVVGPYGTGNVQSLTLTRKTWNVADPSNANRVCAADLTLVPGTATMSGSQVSFHYKFTDCQGGTWYGGSNLSKIAGTN